MTDDAAGGATPPDAETGDLLPESDADVASDGVTVEGTGASSRVATAVVVLTSVGLAAVLGSSVGAALSGALAVATAATFAASLRLVDRDRDRPVALVVAGTLALFVGAGFVASVGFVALGRLASAYPVATLAQVRATGLGVVSATAVALGATLATVGGVASVGTALRAETAREYADLAVKTFVVPLSLAALFVAPTLLAGPDGTEPTLGELLAGALGLPFALLARLAVPQGAGTHALSLVALVAATAASLDRGLAAAPVPEVLRGERRERWRTRTERVQGLLRGVAALAGTATALALAELAVSQAALAGALGGFYGVLTAVTNAVLLRAPLVVLLVASLAVWAVGGLLGRTVRADVRGTAARLGPFLGGIAVVVVAVLAHGVVLDPALSAVARALPGAFGTTFDRQTARLVETFGSAVVALAVAAGLVGLTATFVLTVTVAADAEALHDRATGPTLAAAGLFVASGFGPGAGVDPAVVLAGLVGSFLVWDAGEYGVELARETGDGRTVRPTLTHVGSTLAVGCLLAALARVLRGVAVGAAFGTVPTLRLAFVAVVAGIVLLVATLR